MPEQIIVGFIRMFSSFDRSVRCTVEGYSIAACDLKGGCVTNGPFPTLNGGFVYDLGNIVHLIWVINQFPAMCLLFAQDLKIPCQRL